MRTHGIALGLDHRYVVTKLNPFGLGCLYRQHGTWSSHLGYDCDHYETVDAAIAAARRLDAEEHSQPVAQAG